MAGLVGGFGSVASLNAAELAKNGCRTTNELIATARVGSSRIRHDHQLPIDAGGEAVCR
jgi:hypothetical protein